MLSNAIAPFVPAKLSVRSCSSVDCLWQSTPGRERLLRFRSFRAFEAMHHQGAPCLETLLPHCARAATTSSSRRITSSAMRPSLEQHRVES